MAGRTNDFYSSFKRCMIRFCTNERREERVVYVDDAVGLCFNHLFGNHLHIACQYNEIDVMFFQQLHFCFFLFHFVLFSNREEIERYTETFCHMLKVGMVIYNQCSVPAYRTSNGTVWKQIWPFWVLHPRNKDGISFHIFGHTRFQNNLLFYF